MLSVHLVKCTFLQAKVQMVILGIDLLRTNRLNVDQAGGKLVQAGTGFILSTKPRLSSVGRWYQSSVLNLQSPVTSPQSEVLSNWSSVTDHPPCAEQDRSLVSQLSFFFQLLLQHYEDIVNLSKVLIAKSHGAEHHLRTEGLPIAYLFGQLDAAKLADGSRQNSLTVQKSFGVSSPPGKEARWVSAKVAGCNFFSKIGLRIGYHQIPMHPADIHKAAIIIPFGIYEFLQLTFGWRSECWLVFPWCLYSNQFIFGAASAGCG